jgi:hypothetical protein
LKLQICYWQFPGAVAIASEIANIKFAIANSQYPFCSRAAGNQPFFSVAIHLLAA